MSLARSGFKRKVIDRPPRHPIVPVVGQRGVIRQVSQEVVACPKGPKAKPGKRKPTAIEAKWMDAIVEYGCIACRIDFPHATMFKRPAVHHIVVGGRRLGHLFTLPLCDPGHHQGGHAVGLISRHPWKTRFEAQYGTEMDLLARLKTELGVFDQAEYA